MSVLAMTSFAYVGPGAGLGALGALFAVLAAVFLGLFGLVMYPLQLIRKHFNRSQQESAKQN